MFRWSGFRGRECEGARWAGISSGRTIDVVSQGLRTRGQESRDTGPA